METDTKMHKTSSSGIFVLPGSKKYGNSHRTTCLYEILSFIFQSQVVKTRSEVVQISSRAWGAYLIDLSLASFWCSLISDTALQY